MKDALNDPLSDTLNDTSAAAAPATSPSAASAPSSSNEGPGFAASSRGREKLLSRAGNLLLPRFEGIGIWIEVILLSACALGLGWLADKNDPLHIGSEFPWVWFAPVLLALRYGMLAGLGSAALLFGTWLWWTLGDVNAQPPKLYFLGGLLLTMVCGEYNGVWRTRLRRLGQLNEYLEDRIERLTRRLYLIRLSHDRLEQDLLGRPMSLRDALFDLRRRLLSQPAAGPLPAAEALLNFLAQQSQLDVAALYAIDAGDPPRYTRVAAIGDAPPLDADDALLAYMHEHAELAHVQTETLDKTRSTQHLVAAPIKRIDGRIIGVLVVTRMPFFALTHETLQMLSVLLAAYADGATSTEMLLPVMEALPGCPVEFAEELSKLMRIEAEFNLDSHIVILDFGEHPLWWDAYQLVLRSRRTPDVYWVLDSQRGHSLLANLLPVGHHAAVEGYLLRLNTALQENFGMQMEALHIRVQVLALSDPQCLYKLHQTVAPRDQH